MRVALKLKGSLMRYITNRFAGAEKDSLPRILKQIDSLALFFSVLYLG